MGEKRITLRLNLDKYSHRLAYEIYSSVPKSQRSDYIRLAIILMNDRDKQIKRVRKLLMKTGFVHDMENPIIISDEVQEDMSEPAMNMLNYISQLNTQK